MQGLTARSHNPRSDSLANTEVNSCLRCGEQLGKGARKYCSTACYAAATTRDPLERFWAKVNKGPTCWLWTGNRTGGNGRRAYGQFSLPRDARGRCVNAYAHRWIYEQIHGPIPDGLQVCHHCDVALCVRIDHLYAGTDAQNRADAVDRGRYHTPRPNKQKIADAQLPELFDLRRQGWTLESIAQQYGVTKANVSLILRGERRQYARSLIVPATKVG